MSATNLLHSLYKYKAWSEEELFKCLKAPAAKKISSGNGGSTQLASPYQYC